MKPIARYAWGVLVFNLLIILWGAMVRATGSGAGCGNHWPLCNGVIVPRDPSAETMIALTHRLTSGLAFLLTLMLLIWVYRSTAAGHPVRKPAAWMVAFTIIEVLVGAGLVIFEWVGQDQSIGRVILMTVHLINSFLLSGALTATAWFLSGGEPLQLRGQGVGVWLFLIGFGLMILLGISGGITALSDTLFPVGSVQQGVGQEFQDAAHFLMRLRKWHGVIAILVGLYITFLAGLLAMFRVANHIRKLCAALFGLFVLQVIAGVIHSSMSAPVWMQLIHLLLADLAWISLTLLALANFAVSEVSQTLVDTADISVKPAGQGA